MTTQAEMSDRSESEVKTPTPFVKYSPEPQKELSPGRLNTEEIRSMFSIEGHIESQFTSRSPRRDKRDKITIDTGNESVFSSKMS